MSSFIGHSLAALTIHHIRKPSATTKIPSWWLATLIILASAPDIDYLVTSFRLTGMAPAPDPVSLWICTWSSATPAAGVQTIRITHSLVGSLLLPISSILLLALFAPAQPDRTIMSMQAVGAGLSHVLLDLLVGVTPTALFWPFSHTAIRLPFGILPSAGRIALTNAYLYRNLLIELGVLGPIWLGIYWLRYRYQRSFWHTSLLVILSVISVGCLLWAAQLQRE
jgi:inner membrane protein